MYAVCIGEDFSVINKKEGCLLIEYYVYEMYKYNEVLNSLFLFLGFNCFVFIFTSFICVLMKLIDKTVTGRPNN